MVYRFKEQKEKTKRSNKIMKQELSVRFHEFNNFANVLKRFKTLQNVSEKFYLLIVAARMKKVANDC